MEEDGAGGCCIGELPGELLLHILSFLPFRHLCAARLACRTLAALAHDEAIFRGLVQRHVFCPVESVPDGEWRRRFGELVRAGPRTGPFHIFLSLDNLPIVRRTMGPAQVFVLDVHLEAVDPRPLLQGRAGCLCQRAFGEAPWGRFEFLLVTWGSLFAGVSFYRGSAIHSVYLGLLREDGSAQGCMTSGWNDVTGSFLLRPEEPFRPNVRDNPWGDSFCDFHLQRSEGAAAPLYAVSGGSWTLRIRLCQGGEEEEGNNGGDNPLLTPPALTVHVDWQARGAFVGHAFGLWPGAAGVGAERLWRLRGCQADAAVCLLLEEEEAAGEPGSVCLVLLGSISAGLHMEGRACVDDSAHRLSTGHFELTPSRWVENK